MAKTIMRSRVLIIEDDLPLSFVLQKKMSSIGLDADISNEGKSGLKQILTNDFALAIIDVNLPGITGLEIARLARDKGNKTPIIIITGLGNAIHELHTFTTGANLFHKKPLNFELLETQVKNLLNMFSPKSKYKLGDLTIDPASRSIQLHNREIVLTEKEYRLLLLLLKSEGNVSSRHNIMNSISKSGIDLGEGSIDTLVCRLRNKIHDFNKDIIQTVHGMGYRINPRHMSAQS